MRVWITVSGDQGDIAGYTLCMAGSGMGFSDYAVEIAEKIGCARIPRLADEELIYVMGRFGRSLVMSADLDRVTLGKLLQRLGQILVLERANGFSVRAAHYHLLQQQGSIEVAYFPVSVRPQAVAHRWPPESDGEELVRIITGTPRGARPICY
ncbi:MAG: hypothetical protein HY474_01200 [Candidatus Sungbacteria bacterium]|uniref:Uncharacterized protein n=1 Tax=Candidatus Sungiibacteriota bacterium TaxID=2750080 RepID=A0A932YVK0_9BACT|nr:hypothetical protein [Candidatus Sungbacteria bacterium]